MKEEEEEKKNKGNKKDKDIRARRRTQSLTQLAFKPLMKLHHQTSSQCDLQWKRRRRRRRRNINCGLAIQDLVFRQNVQHNNNNYIREYL